MEAVEHLQYKVVVNHEGQHSLWPHAKANALGWEDVGVSGTKTACLDYIRAVWIDLRPLSLRKAMGDTAPSAPAGHAAKEHRMAA